MFHTYIHCASSQHLVSTAPSPTAWSRVHAADVTSQPSHFEASKLGLNNDRVLPIQSKIEEHFATFSPITSAWYILQSKHQHITWDFLGVFPSCICLSLEYSFKSVFCLLPVHQNDFDLLGFSVEGQFYFECMPMGSFITSATLSISARLLSTALTKLQREVLLLGRRNHKSALSGF